MIGVTRGGGLVLIPGRRTGGGIGTTIGGTETAVGAGNEEFGGEERMEGGREQEGEGWRRGRE